MRLKDLEDGEVFILFRTGDIFKLNFSQFIQPLGTLYHCVCVKSDWKEQVGTEMHLHGLSRVIRISKQNVRHLKELTP